MKRRKYQEESTNVSMVSVSLVAQQSGLRRERRNRKAASSPADVMV